FDEAGYWLTYPSSPELAVMTTPGWLNVVSSSAIWDEYSAPPQLFDTYLAPSSTALLIARYRSSELVSASTSRMPQLGQVADTIWISSAISPAQPASGAGSGLGWPFWLTLRKQPFAVVHAGRPNCAR